MLKLDILFDPLFEIWTGFCCVYNTKILNCLASWVHENAIILHMQRVSVVLLNGTRS